VEIARLKVDVLAVVIEEFIDFTFGLVGPGLEPVPAAVPLSEQLGRPDAEPLQVGAPLGHGVPRRAPAQLLLGL
jgi:hypothetical protein